MQSETDEHQSPPRPYGRLPPLRFGKTPAEAELWVHAVDEKNARLIRSTRAHADLVVTLEGTRS